MPNHTNNNQKWKRKKKRENWKIRKGKKAVRYDIEYNISLWLILCDTLLFVLRQKYFWQCGFFFFAIISILIWELRACYCNLLCWQQRPMLKWNLIFYGCHLDIQSTTTTKTTTTTTTGYIQVNIANETFPFIIFVT